MFYVQRVAVNEDLRDRAWHVHNVDYSQVIIKAIALILAS